MCACLGYHGANSVSPKCQNVRCFFVPVHHTPADRHEQAQNDYNGDFLKVVDIIRSSAVFHSFDDLSRAIVALNKPGVVQVVRCKDRVTTPLPSGYRDVLLNVTVEGCAMVMELQLHLKDGEWEIDSTPLDSSRLRLSELCHLSPAPIDSVKAPHPAPFSFTVIAVKEEAHRIYDFMRTLGW